LRRAAELSLARTSKETLAALREKERSRFEKELNKILQDDMKGKIIVENRVVAAELLLYLRSLPSIGMAAPLRFATDQQRLAYQALLQEPAAATTERQEQAATPVLPAAASVRPPTHPSTDVSVQQQAEDQIRQKANPIPTQIPTSGPSWLKKLFQKKGSPKGGKNGKG
ncbi:MAG TPA: hypothetical protein VGK45_14860, partial [Thermoanaerobaculia bacterium]